VLSKLKYTQIKYSKYKGKRTRQKLARLYEKVTNRRNDFIHKVTKKLIDENQAIALETLNVDGMMKNHKLAQSIQDASWSKFNEFLNYKAEWYGVNILRIGQFEPSSKMCHCGVVNKELKLSDREWTCKSCGSVNDRDLLAAQNIKKFALRNHVSGIETKNHDELPTLVGVMTREDCLQLIPVFDDMDKKQIK
jgi:putative transposase